MTEQASEKYHCKTLDEAAKRGNTIKLIGSIEGENKPTVKPTEIPKNKPAMRQRSLKRHNFLHCEFAAEQTLIGRGAGGIETAGAVLRDLLDIRHKLATKLLN